MTNVKRITDANLNRATEAARILEEIARFIFDDSELSEKFKNVRHRLNSIQENDYEGLLNARDTQNDVGVNIENKSKRLDISSVFKANIKRLQQALRTLAEYSIETPENTKVFEEIRYETYTLEQKMWNKLKEQYNRIKLDEKKLYLITNSDNFETEDDFLNAVASALQGGVDILQFREKKMPACKILELGKKLKQLCLQYDATFIINDRIDIAALLEADGIHLGQDDLDVKSARAILGENAIVGISTQTPEHALKAIEDGADYIGVGPVYDTPTKTDCPKIREEYLKWVTENISLPIFAIGGIDLDNIDEIINNGINKVAVVRAILNAKSPQKAAEDFINILEGKKHETTFNSK